MIVLGYRSNANFNEAVRVIKKHTNMDSQSINQVVSQIKKGQGVNLPDDFCLREDLEDLNFLIA
jgi:transcription elongation factor GreA-like protein